MIRDVDVLVIGAGPAGLAAAYSAASSGARVCIVDDNPLAGGQIWRGGPGKAGDPRAAQLWQSVCEMPNISMLQQGRAVLPVDSNALLIETPDSAVSMRYSRLILATGARERLLPFPGWTLPGVTGAGGMQALAKAGYPISGKRIVVAGSGPLLLAVAATLVERGAKVEAIIEQTPRRHLARFALSLFATPSKLWQAIGLKTRLRGVRYLPDSYVLEAVGRERVEQVLVQYGGKQVELACDYLACGYGLLPNTELAAALGCTIVDGAVRVDYYQRTSVDNIFCAGEGTGVGGVDLSLAEGRIAGLAATGRPNEAEQFFVESKRWQAFARRLERAFALRPELRSLCRPDTIVCRCEDVPHEELLPHENWRSAKLHTRCGMGPCQGRVCGGATSVLYGWTQDAVRTPVSPARIGSLIGAGDSLPPERPSDDREFPEPAPVPCSSER